ncbi:MAG: DUF4815 domain-containing protein [Bacteroidota bacterium]
MFDDYYNRFDAQKGYQKILFRPGRGLQSAELNELQDQVIAQNRGLSDSIMKDGDVISGGELIIDPDTGATTIPASAVYIQGYVRQMEEATLTIPLDRVLYLGIWLEEGEVTEREDPDLRDPATGTRNFQEPGAARWKASCRWGYRDQGTEPEGFYPVFRIDNGVHIRKVPPPDLNSIAVAIARYDVDSKGGDYVVRGMEVIWQGIVGGSQTFSITEGMVHVRGFSISFNTAIRRSFPDDPDTQPIISEQHTFQGDADGAMRIDLSYIPVADIQEINVAKLDQAILNRGTAGGRDLLPNVSVARVLAVKQGTTIYTKDTDYRIDGRDIDWGLGGDEPNSGESYEIEYEYRTNVPPIDPDHRGFTVRDLSEGSIILVDYRWKMPRIDAITLDQTGLIQRIAGISSPFRPARPTIPAGQFVLAEVHQSWWDDSPPRIVNNMVRTVSMDELTRMRQQIADLYDLVAIERLKTDANATEPGTKKGVFVDPFFDDDLRDQGLEQTALIMDGELTLPIAEEIIDLEGVDEAITLEYELDSLLSQPMRTGSMKINPYMAFEPVPPKVRLSPQVDNWTVTQNQWRGGVDPRRWRNTRIVVTRVRRQEAQFLRPRRVRFTIRGFGPEETLDRILFDGIEIYKQQSS